MPYPHVLLDAFQLTKGKIWGTYRIVSATASHEVKEVNKKYHYHLKMHLVTTSKSQAPTQEEKKNFLSLLQEKLRIPQVVFSQYGNPYRCQFIGTPQVVSTKDLSNLFIEWNATAERIYH